MWLPKILFSVCFVLVNAKKEEVMYDIPQGKLKGLQTKSIYHNKPYFSFKGIPYSKPKTGMNKFDPPEELEKWSGILDATDHGSECIQFNPFFKRITGSEDCLFLNVYTPNMNSDSCYPVMVWIHGGGFAFGSGSDRIYGPDFLIEQDLVIVTMNYRLGPLGFINTGDAYAPGNVGLKDQVYALKWVRKNIQHFGGCPNKVTIFGESSGSASVHYHLLSPMSRGLFDRAIQQSGSALDEWAYTYQPRKNALELGETLGLGITSTETLMHELKLLNSTYILNAHKKMHSERFILDTINTWLPSVEPYVEGVENFLPDHPMILLKNGHIADVPMISGVNLDECALILRHVLEYVEKNRTYIYEEMHTLLPNNMNVTDEQESKSIVKEIYEFYFGSKDISNDTANELLEFLTDSSFFIMFHISTLVAKEHIKSPVYKYLFSYRTDEGLFKKFMNLGNVSSHFDDIEYTWYSKLLRNKPRPGANEYFIHLFTKMWSNFARDGDPMSEMDDVVKVKWEPVTDENNILNINLECRMQNHFFPERMNFWVRMYNKVMGEFGELLTVYAFSSASIFTVNVILIPCTIIYYYSVQRNF